MAPPHLAARIEDVVRRVPRALLRRRGWLPTVVAYPGYGAAAGPGRPGWVRLLARVQLARPSNAAAEAVKPASDAPVVRGWRRFVTAPVPGGLITVEVGGARHELRADRSGYVDSVIPVDLPAGRQSVLLSVPGREAVPTWVQVIGTRRGHDLGSGHDLGIVSDIDDTVMVTWLPRPLIAAWNTFAAKEQARRPVPGMQQLYEQLRGQYPDAPVVYLSTGAWNVAATLGRFLDRHGFPFGPLLLTDWGPTNSGWFRSGRRHKEVALQRLQQELPQVRWLLIGDDGQHDPEIYRGFAARWPEHVAAVAIRQLTPGEQVLAHGTPVPLPQSRTGPVAVPVVQGHHGGELAERLRGIGILRA